MTPTPRDLAEDPATIETEIEDIKE